MKSILLCSVALLLPMTAGVPSQTKTIDFEKDKPGQAPKGFSFALTGSGKPGVWVVQKNDSASGRGNVLAQTDADPTGYRFPVAVFDGITAKDVDASVRFKPVSGTKDQGAGIVWRYKDNNNYYIVRANALENNVVLYKLENGKRTDLPLKGEGRTYGKKEKVASGEWGVLRVVARGNLFEVYHDGKKLFEVEDNTFTEAGKVGLWTKADSIICFDDLQIIVR